MIEVTTRLCVEWMTDPADGLNVQLAAVPSLERPVSDRYIEIYNSLDHDWVARNHVSSDKVKNGPVFMIAPPTSSEKQALLAPLLPSRQQEQSPEVPIQFTAVWRGAATAEQRLLAGWAMRACMRVLARRFASHLTDYTRDHCVVRLGAAPPALFLAPVDDELLSSAIIIPFAVLDRWALDIV